MPTIPFLIPSQHSGPSSYTVNPSLPTSPFVSLKTQRHIHHPIQYLHIHPLQTTRNIIQILPPRQHTNIPPHLGVHRPPNGCRYFSIHIPVSQGFHKYRAAHLTFTFRLGETRTLPPPRILIFSNVMSFSCRYANTKSLSFLSVLYLTFSQLHHRYHPSYAHPLSRSL
jgi:hypothetical protein